MTTEEIVKKLKSLADPKNVKGMARFGITPKTKVLGISLYVLRPMAKQIRKDTTDVHRLALNLWKTGIHEARLLAVFIEDPEKVTEKQMEEWVKDFDSWDITDQATCSLFDLTPYAYKKAIEWAKRETEFEKRAGFALMAGLSVSDKKANDKKFYPFLKAIKREATDERNYVKKAVNWALRNIGKFRNQNLYKLSLKTATEILNSPPKADQPLAEKTAKWIATGALRELKSEKIVSRLNKLNG